MVLLIDCDQVLARGLIFGSQPYLRNGWNIMDGGLVFISLIDIVISLMASHSPRIFGILRVFRLLRTLRPLRSFIVFHLTYICNITIIKTIKNITIKVSTWYMTVLAKHYLRSWINKRHRVDTSFIGHIRKFSPVGNYILVQIWWNSLYLAKIRHYYYYII